MPNKILILDQNTTNLIAAGEVVERPASAVKELIENSLDAGANRIDVFVLKGGKKLIQVTDNGTGMNEEDVILATERHATSKIKSAEDLFNLQTLGFRGEALSSIAAVSELEIITKTSDQLAGTKINITGGKITDITPVGASTGTTIKVKNLFFNTPARLHHQKSDTSELTRISDLLSRYALAYPNIAFSLTANEKLILSTSGDNKLINSIASIYGLETAEKMITLNSINEQLHLSGCIGSPEICKASRYFQTVIVNGRYVKSNLISQTVEKAFSTFLPINKYPMFILNISLSPYEIDVNIHPTKTEIKFLDEILLVSHIETAVKQALLTTMAIPGEKKNKVMYPQQNNLEQKLFQEHLPILTNDNVKRTHIDDVQPVTNSKFIREEKQGFNYKDDQQSISFVVSKEELIPNLTFSNQIFETYWLGKDSYGNEYCIDQHAVHERVIYDKLVKEYEKGITNIQNLLIPYVFSFTPQEGFLLEEAIDFLAKFGIEIASLGGNTFTVRSLPMLFKTVLNEQLMKNVLEKLLSWGKINSLREIVHPFCTVLSCRSAIKAGTKIDIGELDYIWQQLSRVDNPYTCPHGRPTVIKLEKGYFDKKFKRI